MDILFWRPTKRRRRNFWDDSESDDYLDFLDGTDSYVDDMDQDSEIMSRPRSPGSRMSTPELQLSSTHPQEVTSLVDFAAKIVAKHVSCEEIESHDPPLDESMLKKIAFWAFPQDESHVKVFSQLTLRTPYEWNAGERKATEGKIKKMRQVGFMVAAFVETRDNTEAKVSLTFEKQHLTSTSCSACSESVFCQHTIAVILERIKNADKVPIHAPVTETLSTLTRDQLQKLLQYAINEDPGGVLGRVFQYIDEIRDIHSEYNTLQGAPDPTFGLLPDEQSTWDISLEKLKKKLASDLSDRYNSYKDTCDIFLKAKTGFHDWYFRRISDLIRKNEVEAAGQILIAIAETVLTDASSVYRWESSTKRVFLDIERMFSCFIASFTGKIRQDMIAASLKINKRIKEAQSTPSFLEPKKWSEMISIKLKKIGESNQAAVDVMDGQENLPFYEPIVASQLPETPDVLIKLYNKEQSTSEVMYDEPLDVMLFRFDCIVQYHQWTDDSSCRYKMCVLGSFILKKLTLLSENYSILRFDEKRLKVIGEMKTKETEDETADVDNEAFEPPPPKRAKRRETKKRKPKEKVKAVKKNVNNFEEIKDEMRRATEDESLDGLSQGQVCYSMLYVSFRIWQTLMVADLDTAMQNIVMEATVRVFELSRFRYNISMDIKEVEWWEQLMDKSVNYMKAFTTYDSFRQIAKRYCSAILHSKLNFYNDFLPLPLTDLLITYGDLPYCDQLKIAVEVLCHSRQPIYQFQHAQNFLQTDMSNLKRDIVKKYKILLSLVFSVNNDMPEQSAAARQVLWHLESVQDGEYVVSAYNCIKMNIENIKEKEDQRILLIVLLNCIKECVLHNGQNGLFSYTTSVADTLMYLGNALVEEFPERVLPLWTELCKYFNKYQMKSILGIIIKAVEVKPSLINDMAPTLQKYFTSAFKHDRECCSLMRIFFPDETKRHQMLKKIATNAQNFTTCALLRLGITEYKFLSKTNPNLNIFSKYVNSFLLVGLKSLKEKNVSYGWSSSGLHLNSKELKYLKWYFGMLAACLSKEIIKCDPFTKLMTLLKEVLKKDVNLMLDFYQAMEGSPLGLKETKTQLGKELVNSYLAKFNQELRNCNHTHYINVLEDMKNACKACEQYVPNGRKEFGSVVITFIRHTFKGKRKLIQLMDEFFPDFIPAKKADKKEKDKK